MLGQKRLPVTFHLPHGDPLKKFSAPCGDSVPFTGFFGWERRCVRGLDVGECKGKGPSSKVQVVLDPLQGTASLYILLVEKPLGAESGWEGKTLRLARILRPHGAEELSIAYASRTPNPLKSCSWLCSTNSPVIGS